MHASLEPVVEVPVASCSSGQFHSLARMFTHRDSISAVWGSSCLPSLFLSAVSVFSLVVAAVPLMIAYPGRAAGSGLARRRLEPQLEQVARECQAVAIRMEGIAAVAQQGRDALQVVQEGELARGVVPFARVVSGGPGGQCREGLDLDLMLPPA